jgi:hypothetical protein
LIRIALTIKKNLTKQGVKIHINSASKKTMNSQVFSKKASNTRLSEFLNPRSLHRVNDWFKNESNEVVDVFLERLNNVLRIYFATTTGLLSRSASDEI